MIKRVLLIGIWMVFASRLSGQQPDLGTEAQRAAGKKIYMKKCAQCHGEKGDGNGIATPFFKPAPRDFTAGKFKIRTTASGELPTDEDLKHIIKRGMPYTGMPAWDDLTDKELTDLVYFIKTFSPDFADPDYVPKPLKMPKAPKYSEASAKKGREVFEANECIQCHGIAGRGDGKSAPTLEDDWGHHIRPADMTKRWTFRGGSTREDIYRTFTTGLNGTPMPSYAEIISPEDRWHLVDYVYSLSKDKPDYATTVVAKAVEGAIDLNKAEALFAEAPEAMFPVVGQVIEPGREFYPSANAINVQAVYNTEDIAFRLTWNDMSAETTGKNNPSLPVMKFNPDSLGVQEVYSDAVAIQLPSKMPEGIVKPYFLFGDKRLSVDLWFVDLAKNKAESFVAKGSQKIKPATSTALSVVSRYKDGQWQVIFKNKRKQKDGLEFQEGRFIPIAFSVWDGFNHEHGNKRGITSWYYLYVEPMQTTSPIVPMVKWGFLTFLLELGLIYTVRRKYKS